MPAALKTAARTSSVNRTETLAHSLAAAIIAGNHPVGADLPNEAAMAAAEGMPLAAVRTALRQVEALGLIERMLGGAVRVIGAELHASYGLAGLAEQGGAYLGRTRLVAEPPRPVVLDAETATLLGAAAGGHWLRFVGTRRVADEALGPLSCIEAWLATRAATLVLPPDLTAATVEEVLGVTIADIEEEVTAGTLTSLQARLLRVRAGGAGLSVLRRFRRRGGATVAALRDIHPADRVTVSVKLRREAG